MTAVFHQENRNSFAIEDYDTVVSGESHFTSAAPTDRAPKRLASFIWSWEPSLRKEAQPTPAQQYLAAIASLFEHPMTKREVAYFHREKTSTFVPLTPEQTQILLPRKK
jgi:hypothetical protein